MPGIAGVLAGRGYVSITPDLTRFNSELSAGVNRSLSGLSKSGQLSRGLSSIGGTLTKFVSAPLALAGAASVKMALDFDQSFAKITALAGNLGVSLDKAKKHVLDLAGQTAQSPQALADALYFVASAGLKASQVMPVLDFAARGAAAGFGDAETLAKSLTTTLNAYSGTNLTAASSMNILTAAVKDGKAEASDFAEGMGQVAGVAATAGISFADLAAAISQASKTLPVDRAITGFRFLIQSLVAPTSKAKDALDSYGISVKSVFDALHKPGGLQHELQFLAKTFDLTTVKGRDAWAAVVGGARGAVAATTLVGEQAAAANKVLDDTNAAGQKVAKTFETAFGKATDTDLFKARAALEKLHASFILLGEKLLPVAAKIIGVLGTWADKFSNLTDATQENIIKFGGLALVLGPVLRIAGGLIGTGAKLAGILVRLGGGAGTAADGIGAVGKAAGPAAGKLSSFVAGLRGLATAAGVAAGVAAVSSALSHLSQVHGFETQLKDIGLTQDQLNSLSDEVTGFWSQFNVGATGGSRTTARALADVQKAYKDLVKAGIPAAEAAKRVSDALAVAQQKLGGFGGGLVPFEQSLRGLVGLSAPVALTSHEILLLGSRMIRLTDSTTAAVPAQLAYMQITQRAQGITAKQARHVATLTDAIYLQGGSLSKLHKFQIANLLAYGDLAGALNILQGDLDRTTGKTNKQASAHRQQADAALDATVKTDGLRLAMSKLHDKKVKINLNAASAFGTLYSFQNALDNLRDQTVNVTTVYSTARNTADPRNAAGAVFPKLAGGAQFYSSAVGPFVAGEGSSRTFAGRGAEVVSNSGVMPLSDQVLSGMGKAAADQVWQRMQGYRQPIQIVLKVDRRTLAQVMANAVVWDN